MIAVLRAAVAAAARSGAGRGGDTRELIRARLEADRQRAASPRQEPLPFGDGFLDDPAAQLGFHGTSVGLARHTEAGQTLCPPCQAWLAELIHAGFAHRLEVP